MLTHVPSQPCKRVRFLVPYRLNRAGLTISDYRPVNWPINHPYWCTGSNDEGMYVVAYVTDESELYDLWPDAREVEIQEENLREYTFTDRFPQPVWFTPEKQAAARVTYANYPQFGKTGHFPYTRQGLRQAELYQRGFSDVPISDAPLTLDEKLYIHETNADIIGGKPPAPRLTESDESRLRLLRQLHTAVRSAVTEHQDEGVSKLTYAVTTNVLEVLQTTDTPEQGYYVIPVTDHKPDLAEISASANLVALFDQINS